MRESAGWGGDLMVTLSSARAVSKEASLIGSHGLHPARLLLNTSEMKKSLLVGNEAYAFLQIELR